eukprot:scaffold12034_cov155-Isochrysis_galbana.AAC.9
MLTLPFSVVPCVGAREAGGEGYAPAAGALTLEQESGCEECNSDCAEGQKSKVSEDNNRASARLQIFRRARDAQS